MAQRNTSNVYTGPMPKEMIANHTLAKEIINRHNDPCPILDDDEIKLLQKFVTDPSAAKAILKERGLEDEADGEPGAKVKESGSLVAHVIYGHSAEKTVLTDREIDMLREWFEGGGANPDSSQSS